MSSCLKVIGSDIKKNPLTYAVLLCAFIVCTAISLYFTAYVRVYGSTPYDRRYNFAVKSFENFDVVSEFLSENTYYCDNLEMLNFGRIADETGDGFYFWCVNDYFHQPGRVSDELYADERYGVILPKSYAERLGVTVGDTMEIYGSEYRVVSCKDTSSVYIRSSQVPANLDTDAIATVFAECKNRLTPTQLRFLANNGIELAPDENYGLFPSLIAFAVLTIVLSVVWAALISVKVCRETDGGTRLLRIMGVKRTGLAAAYLVVFAAFFIAGAALGYALFAVLGNLDYSALLKFGNISDVMMPEDYAIVFSGVSILYFSALFAMLSRHYRDGKGDLYEY